MARRRDFVPPETANFPVSATGTIVSSADCFRRRCAALSRADGNGKHRGSGWVVTFLIIALIAGVLGFGGIAGASVEIAKAIFFIAIILFLVSAVVGLARGRTRV